MPAFDKLSKIARFLGYGLLINIFVSSVWLLAKPTPIKAPVVLIDLRTKAILHEASFTDTADELLGRVLIKSLIAIDAICNDKNVEVVIIRASCIYPSMAYELYQGILRMREADKTVIIHLDDGVDLTTLAAIAPSNKIYLADSEAVIDLNTSVSTLGTIRKFYKLLYLGMRMYRSVHTHAKDYWESGMLDESSDGAIKRVIKRNEYLTNLQYEMITRWLPLTKIDLVRLNYPFHNYDVIEEFITRDIAEVLPWDIFIKRFQCKIVDSNVYLNKLYPASAKCASEIALLSIRGGVHPKNQCGGLDIEWLARALTEIANNPRIKILVLDVDGPGGNASCIMPYLYQVKNAGKKIIVSGCSGIIASADYEIASVGDLIIASRNTFVGSIGVVLTMMEPREMLKKAGINVTLISKVTHLFDLQDYELQQQTEEYYHRFVATVAKSRKMPIADVVKIATGEVYDPERALEIGLIDGVGSLHDTLEIARQMINKPDAVIQWYKPQPFSINYIISAIRHILFSSESVEERALNQCDNQKLLAKELESPIEQRRQMLIKY